MATQVQIRGATQATQEARTLASRELDINTSDKRICIHDGSTAGGVPHLNFFDAQNQEFVYAAASGTDALTITLARAPAAYAQGQKFAFKAANTNTGAATLNVNSLGAVAIYKISGGAIVAVAAGDLVQNGIYEVVYSTTGPYFLLTYVTPDIPSNLTWTYAQNTSISFTNNSTFLTIFSGLPSGLTEIEGVIASGGANRIGALQIGDSGGLETSGYNSQVFGQVGGPVSSAPTFGTLNTTSYIMAGSIGNNAASVTFRLCKIRDTSDAWTLSGGGLDYPLTFNGYKILSSALDRLAVRGNTGSNSTGSAYIRYR